MFKDIKDFIEDVIGIFPLVATVVVVLSVIFLIHVLFSVYYFGSTPKITEGKVIEKHFTASSYSETITPVKGVPLTTISERTHIPAKYFIVVEQGSSKETFYVDERTFYKTALGSYFTTELPSKKKDSK